MFTPQYTGDYQLQAYAEGYMAYMVTLPGAHCAADSAWTCLGIISPFQTYVWPLGVLTAGTTYPISMDFNAVLGDPNLSGEFTILCPIPCIKPTNPTTSNVQATSVELAWNGQYNQVGWEVEIRPLTEPFTGIANYFSTTDSFVAEDLASATQLHWRVRGLCGTFGASEWSDETTFTTLPDCNAHSLLDCEENITLHFEAGTGYWSNLTPCTQTMQGREQILQFTSDGTNRYILIHHQTGEFGLYLKNADNSACEAPTNWLCVTKSLNSSMYTLSNLNPGSTYYLLFKNRSNTDTNSIQLSFHCNVPCHNLFHPSVRLTTQGTQAYAHWDGLGTPWKYQIGMRFADGSEMISPELSWNISGVLLNSY